MTAPLERIAMKTITIQTGNTDDKLTQDEWASFVEEIRKVIKHSFVAVHFFGAPPNWVGWQNAAWVFEVYSVEMAEDIKKKMIAIRDSYGQDSIAWTEGETEFI
jgi:hypothetical protein